MTKTEKRLLVIVADILMAIATHFVSLKKTTIWTTPNSPICEEDIDRLTLALRDTQLEDNNDKLRDAVNFFMYESAHQFEDIENLRQAIEKGQDDD